MISKKKKNTIMPTLPIGVVLLGRVFCFTNGATKSRHYLTHTVYITRSLCIQHYSECIQLAQKVCEYSKFCLFSAKWLDLQTAMYSGTAISDS